MAKAAVVIVWLAALVARFSAAALAPAWTLGYTLTGACEAFSPDNRLVATGDGLYDIKTGARRFAIAPDGAGQRVFFSPDSAWVAVEGDGIYRTETGARVSDLSARAMAFSPDGALIALSATGVFEVLTGARRFEIAGWDPAFNPDGALLAASEDGVYDVATGARQFAIAGLTPVFSPDGAQVAVGRDGVYDAHTGARLLALDGLMPRYRADGTLLAWDAVGLFDPVTGERWADGWGALSPDGRFFEAYDIYDARTGERLLTPLAPEYGVIFGPDGALLGNTLPSYRHFQIDSGRENLCALYGPPDYAWPYRHGIARVSAAQGATIRDAPQGGLVDRVSQGALVNIVARAVVDGEEWHKTQVFGRDYYAYGWLAGDTLEMIIAPGGVAVETP